MTWTERTERYSAPVGALRMSIFLRILDRYTPGRLLDLGAGHGMFARLAADRGWDVTAVDARPDRFQVDDRVNWVVQDVRETQLQEFDMVCCLGLWYHLTLADQLELAARAGGVPLMVDTHTALPQLKRHGPHRKALSRVRSEGDYRGRYYSERGLQARFTASFGNESSFWPTEASLEALLLRSGYDFVESFSPHISPDRRFYLATSIEPSAYDSLDSVISKYIRLK